MSPTPAADPGKKLPLWRLIAGILVLASMVGVLLSLAPVYMENRQLQRYMETLVVADTPDPSIQPEILARAMQLNLPVLPDQIRISHPNGKLAIEIKYAVQMDFSLYQVNVHFHPGAKAH